jgi:alcohol dehydrogenase (cytochrome c)
MTRLRGIGVFARFQPDNPSRPHPILFAALVRNVTRLIKRVFAISVAVAGVGAFLTASQAQNVTYQRLLNADKEPQNWLTYGGDYSSHRFSGLKAINKTNASNLRPLWIYQRAQVAGEFIESNPLIVDGIIYVVEPPSTVTALDGKTGLKLWSWSPSLPKVVKYVGLHANNRGIAILNNTVYVGTLDCHLAALDAKTGALKWIVEVEDNSDNHAIAGAPLAIDGKIIIGTGGGDRGARGLLDAYDAQTGKRLWRLWTVPRVNEPGSETWGTATPGGGDTWNSGTYDPDSNLIYWGTGNPYPVADGSGRPGDNLYTCSLLAVDANTGEMKWHFQFTPHDIHDWDAAQVPVLFEAEVAGKRRKLVVMANRNGFYYVLDRTTGDFISGTPYIAQTWNKGFEENGRPIKLPNYDPAPGGTVTNPSYSGGTNWTAPAFDPENKLFYVNTKEMSGLFTQKGSNILSGDDAYGAIRAWDSITGKLKWEHRMIAPAWISPLATAGGVVFTGDDEGDFLVLDADTGKLLWQFDMGGFDPRNGLATYAIDGKQYVIVPCVNIYVAFGLP